MLPIVSALTHARQTEPKTNPDGDVDLQGRSYSTFKTLPCPNCGDGIVKPSVIFCTSEHGLLSLSLRSSDHSRREHPASRQSTGRGHSQGFRSNALDWNLPCDILGV